MLWGSLIFRTSADESPPARTCFLEGCKGLDLGILLLLWPRRGHKSNKIAQYYANLA